MFSTRNVTSYAKVLMIGTALNAKGGISSVISLYKNGGLFKNVDYLASYCDGSAFAKLSHYIFFLGRYIKYLATHPSLRLIHIHTASYASFYRKSLVVMLAKLFGKKVILHVHGAQFIVFYQDANPIKKAWIRGILQSCDVILALSRQWQSDLQQIAPKARVLVLYNPTIVQSNPQITDNPLNKNENTKTRFLFMGRLGNRKGVPEILKAMESLKPDNAIVSLYGDGPVEEYREAVRTQKLENQIEVNSWVAGPQKDEVFRSADVLLLPSYHEGLPISVLEAMGYGLPILATSVGGIPEAVEHAENGFLVSPGNWQDLAEKMRCLIDNPDLREKFGKKGYQIAQNRFSLPVIIKQLESLYHELL